MAVCGERQFLDAEMDTLLNPTTIVEVLSTTTESYDRGKKFGHYRRLTSLKEYVLVAQDEIRVERFTRRGDDWVLSVFTSLDDTLRLASIDCEVPLREIYDKVEFSEEAGKASEGFDKEPRLSNDADAIIVGSGLAGLVAAAELADAGKRVIIVDQEPEQSPGGQAFWSFGGLFLVDTPEQRRLGVKDSYELALEDWMGTAAFDRAEDHWPRQWAEAYVAFAVGEARPWLYQQGMALVSRSWDGPEPRRVWGVWPRELRPAISSSPGGTGPGVLAPSVRRTRESENKGLITFKFRHRVDELLLTNGAVDGVRAILEPSDVPRE